MDFSLAELAALTGGRILGRADSSVRASRVTTDSRGLRPGEAFLAIRGERFDGHDFACQALESGAVCVLLDAPDLARTCAEQGPVILVQDTLQALIRLAEASRLASAYRVVAVTGSVGKTSTRDMIYAGFCEALGTDSVLRTEANLNNIFGVAQTLLSLERGSGPRYLILELGIDRPGEMDCLASMARPDVAVLTLIGASHLAQFGTRARLLEEKCRLLAYLRSGGLILYPCGDQDLAAEVQSFVDRRPELELSALALGLLETGEGSPDRVAGEQLLATHAGMNARQTWAQLRLIEGTGSRRPASDPDGKQTACGRHAESPAMRAPWRACKPGSGGLLSPDEQRAWRRTLDGQSLQLERSGAHFLWAALYALGAASAWGLEAQAFFQGLGKYQETGRRQHRVDGDQLSLIDDSYNASEESMLAAQAYLLRVAREERYRAVAALASIRELGPGSAELHARLGRQLGRDPAELYLLCGEDYPALLRGLCSALTEQGRSWSCQRAEGPGQAPVDEFVGDPARPAVRIYCRAEREALETLLPELLQPGDLLLVKGSNYYRMDKLGQRAWHLLNGEDQHL